MSENRRDDLIKVIRAAQHNTQGLVIRDDQRVADAVIAWIDRAGVVAEEPEWGWHFIDTVTGKERHFAFPDRELAEWQATLAAESSRYVVSEVVRRRKAGPWVPVEQEPDQTTEHEIRRRDVQR